MFKMTSLICLFFVCPSFADVVPTCACHKVGVVNSYIYSTALLNAEECRAYCRSQDAQIMTPEPLSPPNTLFAPY